MSDVRMKCGGGGVKWKLGVVVEVVVGRGSRRKRIEISRKGRKDNRGIYRMGVPWTTQSRQ